MNRFDGKVAMVSGGASGIGAETCARLSREGARVVVTDIDESSGRSTAEALDGEAAFVPLDVTSEASWRAVCRQVLEKYGRLDVLVNSAGISVPGSIEDADADLWSRTHRINADSVFLGCKYGLEAIRAHSSNGAIVNLASTLGIRPGADQVSYSSSKASVMAVTRSVALHCAQNGYPVRVNAVSPGATLTPMMQCYLDAADDPEAMHEMFASVHPMGRVGRPEELASAIAFLASDEASFITGVNLPVDGGYCAM